MKRIVKFVLSIIAIFIISCLGSIAAVGFSINESKIYGMVDNDTHGYFDFAGYQFENEHIYVGQHGKVEFYYNHWIQTDNEQDLKPHYITLPSFWTGLEYDGKILPRDGYASYRIHTYNLTPGISLSSSFMRMPSKIFFNGILAYEIGAPSKEKQSALVPLEGKTYPYIVPESGEIEVIIEVGNCGIGGIRTMPGFTLTSNLPYPYEIFLEQFNLMFSAGMIIILIFSFFTLALPKKNHHLIYMVLAFFLIYITSVDTPFYLKELGFKYRDSVLDLHLNAFSVLVGIIVCYFYLDKENIIKKDKKHIIIFTILSALFLGSLHFTYNTYYAFISYGFLTLIMLDILYLMLKTFYKDMSKINFLHLIAVSSLYGLMNFSMISSTGVLIFDLTNFYESLVLISMIIFMSVYLININFIRRKTIKNNELKKQFNYLFSKSLIHSLSTKEINNGLNLIKNQYKISDIDGMNATYMFTTSLRNEIKSLNNYFSLFDEESKILLNKVNFNNLLFNKNINIIFDVDRTNFEIPSIFMNEVIDEIFLNDDGDVFISANEGKLVITMNKKRIKKSEMIDSLCQRMKLLNWEFKIVEEKDRTFYLLERE